MTAGYHDNRAKPFSKIFFEHSSFYSACFKISNGTKFFEIEPPEPYGNWHFIREIQLVKALSVHGSSRALTGHNEVTWSRDTSWCPVSDGATWSQTVHYVVTRLLITPCDQWRCSRSSGTGNRCGAWWRSSYTQVTLSLRELRSEQRFRGNFEVSPICTKICTPTNSTTLITTI